MHALIHFPHIYEYGEYLGLLDALYDMYVPILDESDKIALIMEITIGQPYLCDLNWITSHTWRIHYIHKRLD